MSVFSRLSGLPPTATSTAAQNYSSSSSSSNKNNNNNNHTRSFSSADQLSDRDHRKRPSSSSQTPSGAIKAVASVPDWSQVDVKHLISWIERKCSGMRIRSHTVQASTSRLDFTIPHANDVKAVLRLNGYTYNGQLLTVQLKQSSDLPVYLDTPNVHALLCQFIQSRISADAMQLNLCSVYQVQPLMQVFNQQQQQEHQLLDSGCWNVVFKAAQSICPQVQTLLLDDNQFTSLDSIAGLSHYLPHIRNLSLANNQLSQSSQLSALSDLKQLSQLILANNPLVSQDYVRQISSLLPTVEAVDSQTTALPPFNPHISGNFFDSDGSRMAAESFLIKYISIFDSNNRSELIDAYCQHSVFSLCVNPTTPAGYKSGTSTYIANDVDYTLKRPVNRGRGKDSGWWTVDRNLLYKASAQSRSQQQMIGPINIVHQLSQLPQTTHKHPGTFLMDCWQHGNAQLFIHVHGEFQEGTHQRYFDRSFILVPSAAGSKSAVLGWPAVIVNDSLTVRALDTPESLNRLSMKSKSVVSFSKLTEYSNRSTSVIPPQQQDPANQQQLVSQFSAQTGLTMEWSIMCLEQHGWNGQLALEGLAAAQLQNRVPAEAFMRK